MDIYSGEIWTVSSGLVTGYFHNS